MIPWGRVELPAPPFSGPRSTGGLPWHTSPTSMIPKKFRSCYDGTHRSSFSRGAGNQNGSPVVVCCIRSCLAKQKLPSIFVVAVGLLIVSIPRSAHHDVSGYDLTKVITKEV